VRQELGFNLTRSDFDRMLQDLLGDPVTLCDVIFCLIKPEAEKQNVSDADFGRAMAGDTIERAATALLEELADFTPNARDRAQLQRVIAALWSLSDKARDLMDQKMKAELDSIHADVARLSARAAASTGAAKADAEEKLAIVSEKWTRAKLELERVETATATSWDEVQDGFGRAYGELTTSFGEARQWLSEKIAP